MLFISCLVFLKSTPIEITKADRDQVIQALIFHLEKEYVNPVIGERAAKELKILVKESFFSSLLSGEAFEKSMNQILFELTQDGHLRIENVGKLSKEKSVEGFTKKELEKYYGAHKNFGIQKVERLDGNVGYIELSVFPPLEMGGDSVAASMNLMAHTEALIIDLRRNSGGFEASAVLMASYLFDENVKPLSGIYDRASDSFSPCYTQAFVPGPRFGSDKPVYILVSEKTFSAAEFFAYSLQALGRAKVIGDTTGGGAHPFEYRKIHPNFILWSVTQKSLNPITNSNWEGRGVDPNTKCEADQALATAIKEFQMSRGTK